MREHMSEFTQELTALFTENGLEPAKRRLSQMEAYYEELVAVNRMHNLTAITAPKDAALRHFFDSVAPQAVIPEGAAVADVGSGAGFPIVPLKIMRGDIRATAVESAGKKCAFIERGSKAAEIDVEVLCTRAEELARGPRRESFDVCVSRAVAQLRVLAELCAPLVRQGGLFLAYKGEYERELAEAQNAAETLNLELADIIKLPCEGYAHHVLVFRKTGMLSPKYPRRYAQIVKTPL